MGIITRVEYLLDFLTVGYWAVKAQILSLSVSRYGLI